MVGFDFAFAFVTEEDESFLVRFELETELEFVVLVIFSIFEFFEFFVFFEFFELFSKAGPPWPAWRARVQSHQFPNI